MQLGFLSPSRLAYVFRGQRPGIFFHAGVYHIMTTIDDRQCALRACGAPPARNQKKRPYRLIFPDYYLTGTSCSIRVWNQFQLLETSGVCDE
jgi:hypothetical protein